MDQNEPPKKPFWLRKLRRGVSMRFNGYDRDGIPHWLLYDEGRNKFYVVGWPEYEMLSRWHLADPKAIIDAVNKETKVHVDMKDFENLESFLHRNYLVEQRWRNIYIKAKEQKVIKGENIFYWFIRYYLFFRIPLFSPDKFLNRTKVIGNILFSKITMAIMTFLGIVALYQIGQHWEEFKHTFASIFSWQGLFFYFIAFTFAKFFHEFGHAYMAKRYGISVPAMGVAFLVFWPVLYTDTTQSWSLPSQKRLRIALAGMWVETYVTIIAALIWANVHNLTIQMICYVTVAVNWVSTLLINVSPFMRFDGYYAFSDLLNMPNLQSRSFALARWQLRNWLFGWEDPLPEQFSKKMHWLLVGYAFVTWIYRLIIYFAIAILVYHYFFKALGILLFLVELFAFILRPLVQEAQVWYELRKQFRLNLRTLITITFTVIFLALLFVPLNQQLKMNATLSYEHKLLYATQDGILQNPLPQIDSKVEENQTIAELKSPELEQNLNKTKLQYDKLQIEVKRASFNEKYANLLGTLQAELASKRAQYDKLLKLKEELNIKAPFNGIIGDVASNITPGVMIMKNSWIVDVVNPNLLLVEAFVEQSNFDLLNLKATGYFYPLNLDSRAIPVKMVAIEPVKVPRLAARYSRQSKEDTKTSTIVDTPVYNANEFGGKIAAEITEKGEYIPVESIYRILLVADGTYPLKQIEIGTVILDLKKPRPFIYQMVYKLKKIIVQEANL